MLYKPPNAHQRALRFRSSVCHITGLPYSLAPTSNDGWSASGNVEWNIDGKVRLGYNLKNWFASGSASIIKTFYLPGDVNITLVSSGDLRGSGGTSSRYQTTFTINVSGQEVYSTKSTSGDYLTFDSSEINCKMTAANSSVKLNNSYSTSEACTRISKLNIYYR